MPTIRADHSNLPRAHEQAGFPPSQPMLGAKLAAAIEAAHHEAEKEKWGQDGGRPLAIPEAGPYRGSYAGKVCDRELWNAFTEQPVTNPPRAAQLYRFDLGHIVHEIIQSKLPMIHPHIETEVPVDLRPAGFPGSASLDGLTYLFEESTQQKCADAVIEIKSVTGYPYKLATTTTQGPPAGPKHDHRAQAEDSAVAVGARRVFIVYGALETLSPSMLKTHPHPEIGAFLSEWQYPVDEAVRERSRQRAQRVNRVLEMAQAGIMPARELHDPEVPTGAVIQDPSRDRAPWTVTVDGAIVNSGTHWKCGYCDYRDLCIQQGAGGGGAEVEI